MCCFTEGKIINRPLFCQQSITYKESLSRHFLRKEISAVAKYVLARTVPNYNSLMYKWKLTHL